MEKHLAGALLLSLSLTANSSAAPARSAVQAREGKPITIRVHNYTEIEPALLLKGERAAGRIFKEVGVDVVWLECYAGDKGPVPGTCAIQPGPLDLTLNLLPRSMSQRLPLRADAFGFAVDDRAEGFAYYTSIFYDDVKDCAVRNQHGLPELLGSVIAHELGHLLLGPNSHSVAGLMSAHWSAKVLSAVDHNGMSFSSSESRRIQRAVIARWLATLANAQRPVAQPTAVFGPSQESR